MVKERDITWQIEHSLLCHRLTRDEWPSKIQITFLCLLCEIQSSSTQTNTPCSFLFTPAKKFMCPAIHRFTAPFRFPPLLTGLTRFFWWTVILLTLFFISPLDFLCLPSLCSGGFHYILVIWRICFQAVSWPSHTVSVLFRITSVIASVAFIFLFLLILISTSYCYSWITFERFIKLFTISGFYVTTWPI